MLILITYDINTESAQGRRRLRQVSKQCVNYGQRVQHSVFECVLDAAQFAMVKHKLCDLIDLSTDSIRFYNLGNNHKAKVEHYGAKPAIDVEGTLIL